MVTDFLPEPRTALRSLPADTAGLSPEPFLFLLRSQSRSSRGMRQFCLLRRTCARYGKGDTLCAKLYCLLSVCRCICISADFQSSVLVSPSHDTSELACDCSVYGRDDSIVNASCGSIQGDRISFVEFFSAQCKFLFASSITMSPHPDTQQVPYHVQQRLRERSYHHEQSGYPERSSYR